MAYKQSPGRMNMPKTGAGIPSALTMPDPKDPKPNNVKYGDIQKSSSTNESGRTTVTVTQNFSKKGGKTNKTYKQFEEEGGDVAAAKKFNIGKSGSRTTTYSYGGNKGAGIKPVSTSVHKPKIDLNKKPSSPKNNKGYFYKAEVVQDFGGWKKFGRASDLAKVPWNDSRSSYRPVTDRESQLMKSDFYNPRNHPMKNKNNFDKHLQNIETFERRKNDKKFARQELIKSRRKAKK
jgi:hypothetical protein